MGMAASQARLLMLTARIHDVEYQAQKIQSAKLELATQEDEVYRKYNEALDATTLTFRNDEGSLIPANFNNLCGLASINNGMNKNYVFRTGDSDQLIVPNEVYEGYKNFEGDNPYEFAMYMLGISQEDLEVAEEEYIKTRLSSSGENDPLVTLKASMDEIIDKIADLIENPVGDYENAGDSLRDNVDAESLRGLAGDSKNPDEVMKLADEYEKLNKEFKYKLYTRGGAENIYGNANKGDKSDFDQDTFNYYLRWGMLINQEVGLEYCIPESDYTAKFGNDAESLNHMLMTGRITVDVVSIGKKGEITDDTTTVASDSNLAETPTSTIDKKALAVAEAEYEHAMKKIDKKDKQYDMELNKLETERTALTTEYDSVKKVIQDNIERTFGIFS